MDAQAGALAHGVQQGLIALGVAVVVATAAGLILRRRAGGRFRLAAAVPAADVLTEADLGAPLGDRATLVQFSTAFCAPCRPTRLILSDAARIVPGVRHIDIDATTRLDLARRLRIASTPTVLVLDRAGTIASRATGQPRRTDVFAALGQVVDGPAVRAEGKPAVDSRAESE